jgi:hypothetical protein
VKKVKIRVDDLEWLYGMVESEWQGTRGMLFHSQDSHDHWARLTELMDKATA